MIAFFRKNILSISLMLLPYAILIRIKSLISPVGYQLSGHESPMFEWLLEWINTPQQQAIASIVLVFIQSVAINRLVIKNRISNEQSLIPGLIYILFASMIPDFLLFTPELISSSLLIAAIRNLFKVYGKKATTAHTFNVGVLISISSLIYYPSVLFLIIGIIGFIMLRSINLKGLLQLLLGTIFPYFMLFTYYYYNGSLSSFSHFYTDKFHWINLPNTIFITPYFSYGIILALTLIMFFMYNSNIKAKSIQTQEKIDLLYFYLLLFLGIVFFIQGYSPSYLIFSIMPISIFFTLWMLRVKSRILLEFLHLGFLIVLILIQFIL